MSEADRLWDELDITYSRWGLTEIPFSESASTLRQSQLREVFTGREKELKEVFNLFRGRERKRLLVYGWVGIGKTAFILEVLGVLQRKAKDTLAAYISLPPETDLATAALIALAREMKDDEWAQHQLNQMGLRPRKPARKRKGKIKAGISVIEGGVEEETSLSLHPSFLLSALKTCWKGRSRSIAAWWWPLTTWTNKTRPACASRYGMLRECSKVGPGLC